MDRRANSQCLTGEVDDPAHVYRASGGLPSTCVNSTAEIGAGPAAARQLQGESVQDEACRDTDVDPGRTCRLDASCSPPATALAADSLAVKISALFKQLAQESCNESNSAAAARAER